MITFEGKLSGNTNLPNFTEEEWEEFIHQYERSDILEGLWNHIQEY